MRTYETSYLYSGECPRCSTTLTWCPLADPHGGECGCGEDAPLDDTDEGYFVRWTMPGYLDCSEWHGPFPNRFRALRWVIESDTDSYGPDEAEHIAQ